MKALERRQRKKQFAARVVRKEAAPTRTPLADRSRFWVGRIACPQWMSAPRVSAEELPKFIHTSIEAA